MESSDFERKIEDNKGKTKVHLEIPKFKAINKDRRYSIFILKLANLIAL